MPANIWEDIKLRYQQGNIIIRLIMVNVAVHIAMLLLNVVVFLISGNDTSFWIFVSEWLHVPSELSKLPFRFWTFFTYMFMHANFFHILMNMLVLYWFGYKLIDLLPQNKVFPIYVLGGIVGALFFIIGFNIFPPFYGIQGHLVGASASIMAIVLAAATLNPKGTVRLFILGTIELQYIALAWILYNLLFTLTSNNPGGALAHLGGAFMGWYFIYKLRKGKDYSIPVNNLFSKLRPSKTKRKTNYKRAKEKQGQRLFKSKMKVYKGASRSDFFGNEYGRSFIQKYKEMSKEECLNTILGKIKLSGYDSLTEDEKIFLDRYN